MHGLSCSASGRNFLDQECNFCSLHWQQDSTTRPPGKALLFVDWERGNRLWPPRPSKWNKEQTLTVTIYGGKQCTKKDRTGKQESSHILNNKSVTRTWKSAFPIWTFQAIILEDKRPHQRDGSHDNCGNLDQEALGRPRSLLQAFQWVQPRPEELSS